MPPSKMDVERKRIEVQLKELLVTKKHIEAQLLRFEDFVRNYDNTQSDLLLLKLRRAEGWLEEFGKVFTSLKALSTEVDETTFDEEFIEFEDKYDEIICIARRLIPRSDDTSSSATGNLSSRTGVQGSLMSETRIEARIKLPSLGLPEFKGNYEDWAEFNDTFEGIVTNNPNLTSAQKLQYLKSSLKGEAAKVVQALKICDANYEVAWTLLKRRYNLRNLIAEGHMNAMLELPKLSKENASQLRSISDIVTKSLRGLEAAGINTENWDTLLIHIIISKLDPVTFREWKTRLQPDDLPKLVEFNEFLEERCNLLESLNQKQASDGEQKRFPKKTNLAVTSKVCELCNQPHLVSECPTWNSLTSDARINNAKLHRLCFRCLMPWNRKHFCKRNSCTKCRGNHHTLLHVDIPVTSSESPGTSSKSSPGPSIATAAVKVSEVQVLLSTARVILKAENGNQITCKALLDCAAQSNFIRTRVSRWLKLNEESLKTTICGINARELDIHSQVSVNLKSSFGGFERSITCLVIDEITGRIPGSAFPQLELPRHIRLADPNYHIPEDIDLLLGADVFWQVLEERRVDLGPISLRQSTLGWLITGSVSPGPVKRNSRAVVNVALTDQVSKFWQIEHVIESDPWSLEQRGCENQFVETIRRDASGRFVVTIPLKASQSLLGNSFEQAKKRFFNLEKRFRQDAEFHQLYSDFMKEYCQLGHMTLVNDDRFRVYLPHHGVLKPTSTTTKLRTVFDSSAKTSTGYAFNEIQMVGPTIQEDLMTVLLNFRLPKYAVTADAEKMYRQILVEPNQRHLQSILWRATESQPLQVFELNTVTYGTASAPYLATRCIKQIALDIESEFPTVAKAISRNMYVDDFLGGADTLEDACNLVTNLRSTFESYGLKLRKWLASDPSLLKKVSKEIVEEDLVIDNKDFQVKTLGVVWKYLEDNFTYQIHINCPAMANKRNLLSFIAKIYDPLGWVSPCVMVAKLLLQELWRGNLSWDELLPDQLLLKWTEFVKYLPQLNQVKIPRRITQDEADWLDMHGFADASKVAFGACVYIASGCGSNVTIRLVCAKSRVAPLNSATIPRLELCAAALLSRLVHKLRLKLDLKFRRIILWTDSTIALSWIRTEPYKLKEFVANRVAQIQELNVTNDWRHVASEDNPADLISRGMRCDKILESDLWWTGPTWLKKDELNWPQPTLQVTSDLLETKSEVKMVMATMKPEINPLLRISNFKLMLRVSCRILRWVEFTRNKGICISSPISPAELDRVLKLLIKREQEVFFKKEFAEIRTNGFVSKGSSLFRIHPFIDADGLLRVSGRLSHSYLDYEMKHQIILPFQSEITRRIATTEHQRMLHCGGQQLLYTLRERYWPIKGRVLSKEIVRKCIKCFRCNPKSQIPLFGNLPKERVSPLPPFTNTGIDYGGPFQLRDRSGRNYKILKGYLCVFVCFSSKAIHLELVSDLTAEAFVACLRRFISRRGKPKTIFSDNATNFVGSNNMLQEMSKMLEANKQHISNVLVEEGVEWRFIPPRAPNFGGLWEAGVKSVKRHLKRVLGETLLKFEEFYTLLTQIEAILNSRPLSPLSTNPEDLNPLTPGHFLILRPLVSLIDERLIDVKVGRLSRYQLVQQVVQNFWNRWRKEYLNELQYTNGTREPSNIQPGSLVIVKEDNVPPCRWKLARVCSLECDSNNIARVAQIKTSAGKFRRPVSKLCLLPLND